MTVGSGLVEFWTQVIETGQVVVPPPIKFPSNVEKLVVPPFYRSDSDVGAAGVFRQGIRSLLCEMEHVYRNEWPGYAPRFDVTIAERVANRLFVACQYIAYRDTASDIVVKHLAELKLHTEEEDQAVLAYSVDVVLRVLPDIYKLACGVSSMDAVAVVLREMAIDFPLSSVGMRDVLANDAGSECPVTWGSLRPWASWGGGLGRSSGVMEMYVDRIIFTRDVTRLTDPVVLSAVRRAAGEYAKDVAVLSMATGNLR